MTWFSDWEAILRNETRVAYILAEIGQRESSRTFGGKSVLEVADVIDNGKNFLSKTKVNTFYLRKEPDENATEVICNLVCLKWSRIQGGSTGGDGPSRDPFVWSY